MLGRPLFITDLMRFLTLNDIQGCTELEVFEAVSPYRQYDFQGILYVRPDGMAYQPERLLAVVELDVTHGISVIDMRSWKKRLFKQYADESTRPEHAHNLSLVAFDPSGTELYVPGPSGCIYQMGIYDDFTKIHYVDHNEVVGVFSVRSDGLLVSADVSGGVHLWQVDSGVETHSLISSMEVAYMPFLTGDLLTTKIDFEEN